MSSDRAIHLLGLPYEGPDNFVPGASMAPSKIRWARESLEDYSLLRNAPAPPLVDLGDLDLDGKTSQEMVDHVEQELERQLPERPPCIFLGGDHLVSLPAIAHYWSRRTDFGIIHMDAHLDRRDVYLGGSRFSYATVMARVAEMVGPDRIHSLGFRAKEPEEPETGVPFHVLGPLTELLRSNPGPFYFSLDLDVLDPSVFPSVTNPEPLGIQLGELVDSINLLRGKLIAADIVEYNPLSCADLHPAVTVAFLVRELSLCFESP